MLTKKYQIVYNTKSKIIILDIVAYEGQQTNVPKEFTGVEFDTRQEADEYIKIHELVNEIHD